MIQDSNAPVSESPFIAFILAIIAGSLNGFTYNQIGAFSTVQSGNMILLGESIATKNWDGLFSIAVIILAFGAGSMMASLIELVDDARKRVWAYSILSFEIIVLVILAMGLLNHLLTMTHICLIISFVAGMQGNGFHKIKGFAYGNTAVTQVVQQAFNYFTQVFFGKKRALRTSMLYLTIVIGFVGGGFIGTIASAQIHEKSLFIPAALLALLVVYLYYAKARKGEKIDSSY